MLLVLEELRGTDCVPFPLDGKFLQGDPFLLFFWGSVVTSLSLMEVNELII